MVTKTGTGDGTVTPSTGVLTFNGNMAMTEYPANSQVILTGTPADGSTFVAWTGCDVPIGNKCTVTMSAEKIIAIEFRKVVGKKPKKDFNGDGKADMLWQDITTGDVYVWLLNDGTAKSGNYVARGIPSDWQIRLSEDFDGDGKADVLWQNTNTGAVYIWLMNGAAIASGGYVVRSMPQDWQVRGVGDFNGDGKADILWQSRDVGDVFGWLMNGINMQDGSGFVVKGIPSEWQIKAVADYNGDGKTDILLHNTVTGKDVIWLMDGITIKGADFVKPKAGAVSVAPLKEHRSGADSWDMKTSGDYNGDGMNDMVWQDGSTGDVYMWFMDGTTITSGGYVEQGVPSEWSIY
ncbi:FG-GAP repeat-containing protein [Candidatus Magnetobacterium bavaricum]|uniref:FG-GAP repeat-containing protein n=1 Tax=Candidatus Magnetobacterium bavaricum TaxID=29290 RepID=A0A0F3GY63_9BACT|nr:FG-GAP repeat-containing protein [Candidatus Magnetobacterium bavaricum]